MKGKEERLQAPNRKGQFASICYRFSRNRMAMLGLVVFLIVLFFAISAPLFANYEEEAIKQNVYEKFAPPSSEHILGMDLSLIHI